MCWCFGREWAALLVSHVPAVETPCARGSPHHPQTWQLGIARSAMSSIPVSRYRGADMFGFACDEVHLSPEPEEGTASGS